MGFLDKIKNKAQQAKGRGKQETGRRTDDPYLEAEGGKDRTTGTARQVGEQVKDAAKEARRGFDR